MTSALPHGYGVSDTDAIARSAAWSLPGVLSYADRHDTGRHAIIVALHEADTDPGRPALFSAAYQAISHARNREMSTRGYSTVTGQTMRNAAAFWTGTRRPHDWLEESIVERIALRQILAIMPRYQRQALRALAEQDGYDEAAAYLGIARSTLAVELRDARKRFKSEWFWPDTPPRRNMPRGNSWRKTA